MAPALIRQPMQPCPTRPMWPIAFAWFKRAGTYKNKIGDLMSYENIIFDLDGGIARITFNRPDKLNSFTAAMHGELADALTKVEAGGVRVLVLTGNGRGFCAGQDLSEREMSAGSAPIDPGSTIEKYYAPLVRRLRALPLPVVVGVNGVAAGAGANLALDRKST